MRCSPILALSLSVALAACTGAPQAGDDPGTPGADAGGKDDDPGDPGGGGGGGDEPLEEPAQGFQLVTPDIEIGAGEEVTYCYYTTLPVETLAAVKRWESKMTPGSHHLILYFTNELQQPDGTLDDSGDCGLTAGDFSTVWTYAAQEPEAEFTLPEGVGMEVQPDQPVVMQMHYLNASDAPLTAHVTINGHTYEDGVEYQQAYPYVTYNNQINVQPGQSGSVQGSCAVPEGAKFFTMSTHSHQFSTSAQVLDGDDMLVDTVDWEHPAVTSWVDSPHYEFEGNLTYRCEYFNGSDRPVTTGDSAETDEMCMAIGYFFGGNSGPIGCLNSFAVPL